MKPASTQPKQSLTTQHKILALILSLTLLANAGLGYWLQQHFIKQPEEQQLEQLSRQQAQQQARAGQDYLRKLSSGIKQLSNQPLVRQALNDQNQMAALQALAQQSFPQLLQARVFKTKAAVIEREGEFPIRYTELDMINRAENRDSVYPEAYRLKGQQRLNLAVAIDAKPTTGGTTQAANPTTSLGTLLLILDAQDLASIFAGADSNLGQTQLLQQYYQDKARPLAAVGSGNAGPSVIEHLDNSYWHIQFTPSQQLLAAASINPLPLYLGLLLLLLSSSAGALWLGRRLLHKPTAIVEEAIATNKASTDADNSRDSSNNPIFVNSDILNIDLVDGDSDILGIAGQAPAADDKQAPASPPKQVSPAETAGHIFRAYDIRGIYPQELTLELAGLIGKALGSEAIDQGETSLIVGRDGRTHSPEVSQALVSGILSSGCQVINIGMVPTPLMYFATHQLQESNSGVMITASHNPGQYNGVKIMLNHQPIAGDDLQALRRRIVDQHFHSGSGEETQVDISGDYIERIFSDVALAGNISVVVDAGNGVTGKLAPRLLEELGCQVTPLFCEIDGNFPNHEPDPTRADNLSSLISAVQSNGADLGIAFDGDGDRLVVVSGSGAIITPDRLLMLFAKDIIAANPGSDVIYDVKCSRQLSELITNYGGRPIMWKCGHSNMKAKMAETGALLGGEFSGHVFIKDRWYGFDDGIYSAARLLEIITLRDQSLDDIFAALPQLPASPLITIASDDQKKFDIIQQLIDSGDFPNGKISQLDGLRVDFGKGWGLVRVSNTSPSLTLRFEGETEEVVSQLKLIFKRELLKVDDSLTLDF